jgi:hypothetical protein
MCWTFFLPQPKGALIFRTALRARGVDLICWMTQGIDWPVRDGENYQGEKEKRKYEHTNLF